jgi:SAM-dependent methyltransferase
MGHAWVSQQAVISDVFTSVTSVSLNAAAAKLGEHVIDIGCGTGDTLLAFAKVVGPSGAVLGVDVSAPMLPASRSGMRRARRRARAASLLVSQVVSLNPSTITRTQLQLSPLPKEVLLKSVLNNAIQTAS